MSAYCEITDLLTGDIPVPVYLSEQKFVNDAADEIDSMLGFIYQTPIVMVDTSVNRPARLLLKRINAHLATGRLLMAAAASDEDTTLHAYAKSLVDQSLITLDRLASREILIEGATVLPSVATVTTGPLQYNKDPASIVDSFYDDILWNDDPIWYPVRLPYGP